ncbi:alpha-glucan family phosphorylase [Hippea maritima]|uniref:Alpha-glucan phosphorylase n=1 Tax=Hippea maritima (strain ATCC 700847 / DSM 10411 / MH2) TaxID=760142 RepID=F2LVY7_HIPMA|nr:alpha-glucan family phosphorylase [Hippea maritima]AEA33921.1 alpha-glucan phosphorylase [Hippea maritima DSM 10411]
MNNLFLYMIDEKYSTRVAYFSMEFAIDQALKTYSGGLGFLAGSHMRSANHKKQATIGVGMLWSFGYYDQTRNEDNTMKVEFRRKFYYFIEDTGTRVKVNISGKPITVKAYLLPGNIFETAPILLLTTDTLENDFLSRTISYKLYDANEQTRIAQEIILGIGGVRVLKKLGIDIDVYHLNEGHALPLAFELMKDYPDLEELKKHIVFTTHTPEKAGNEEHDINLLSDMGFFGELDAKHIQNKLNYHDKNFSLTVAALKLSKRANAVSKIHHGVSNKMWSFIKDRCEIVSITNAQNMHYWADKHLLTYLQEHEDYQLIAYKKHLKHVLFEEVADQTGKIFDPNTLTLVWARRFVEYKRPWLLIYDMERFRKLVNSKDYPIQIIWAGKPHPNDYRGISMFNEIVMMSKEFKNVAVLTGYELKLSKLLKQGADIWLNTPRWGREASGTSGMTAAANAAIHFSVDDGWHAEFQKDGINCFTIFHADPKLPIAEQDRQDYLSMMEKLENIILPMYYNDEKQWISIVKTSMTDVMAYFDSSRMVDEYYEKLYKFGLDSDTKNETLKGSKSTDMK